LAFFDLSSPEHYAVLAPRDVDLISDTLPFGTTDNVSGRYRSVNKFDAAKPTQAGVS
jgi:hypothetical protein